VIQCEAGEVERPSGLPLVQLLGCHEVLQVLVIRPDLTLMFRALDKVPPLLEGSDNCQHLLVVDLVVPLNGGQGLGEESNWVPLFIFQRYLGEDRTCRKVGAVSFNRKGLVGSGEMRTGVEVTLPFNLANAVCSASPQRQPESFWVKSKSGRACSEKSRMNHQ